MEYPFKDLLPLDEVLEREGYYKDWTHLDPEVFYSLTQISEYIKTKGYGVDVRLLIAQLAEHFGLKTTQVVDLANLLQQNFTTLEGVTQSFTNNINSLVAQMEADKDAVIANATVDSEVILARGGKPTLQDRLDETTAKLEQAEDSIRIKSPNNYLYDNGPVFAFVTDDAQSQDWTRFKPIFDAEGVPANVCVITDWVGNPEYPNTMSLSQLKELKANGWTVASHTKTHARLAEVNGPTLDQELRESHEWLKKHGFDSDIIVYPFGSVSDAVRRYTRKYYDYGVDIDSKHISLWPLNGSSDIENTRIIRAPGLSQPASGGSLDYVKNVVDLGIANNDLVIFEDHSHYAFFNNQENLDKLRDLIRYIKSKGYPILNLSDALRLKGNLIEVDNFDHLGREFVVERTGGIRGGSFKVDNTHDLKSTTFDINKITVRAVSTAEAGTENFPEKKGGTLFTSFISHASFAHQKYVTITGNEYIRTLSSGIWTKFKPLNGSVTLARDTYSISSNFADFPEGTTVVPITSVVGSPSTYSTGTLITHKYEVGGIYINHQILLSGDKEYRRYATTAGTWTSFV